MRYTIFLFPVAVCLCSGTAYGYIDPGTGSAVFSAVGYVIAAAGAFFVLALKPFKMLFTKILKRNKNKDKEAAQEVREKNQ